MPRPPGTNPPAPPLLSFIPSNGWYAVDHGRLSLGLQSLPGQPSMLTWGDEPSASTLSLVNSVRLNLDPTGKPAADGGNKSIPPELALLAPDRGDAPDLFEIDGATIGLWQVDPDNGEIAAADLTIRYDDALCTELGASQSSLQLWTLGSTALTWQPASSTSLDLADHLISGFGEDFSYFAVSVTPAPGRDVDEILAHPLAGIAGPASSQAVPEPASLSLLAVGTALLGRRRRRSASRQGVAHK